LGKKKQHYVPLRDVCTKCSSNVFLYQANENILLDYNGKGTQHTAATEKGVNHPTFHHFANKPENINEGR